MPTGFTPTPTRRHDFDWLRIGALGLLIVTHTTYIYASWNWRAHSPHAGLWGDVIIEALAPWRMSLVFFVAGAAVRFIVERMTLGEFVQNRVMRLFVPFLFATIFIVQPTLYAESSQAREHNFLYFLTQEAMHLRTVYGVGVPDLAHVWFLSYVFAYALLAGVAWRFAQPAFRWIERAIGSAPVVLVVAGTAGVFVLANSVLAPIFGRTNLFVDDPAGHVRCLLPFLLGLFLARSTGFWTRLRSARASLCMLAGVLVFAIGGLVASTGRGAEASLVGSLLGVTGGVYGAITLFAILALASSMLNRRGPGLSYLGDAIMPVYLMHQPVLVITAKLAVHLGLPLWIEYPLLLAAAAGIPLLVYHLAVRPYGLMRVLFGLKAGMPETKEISAPAPIFVYGAR